jgi:hypothetical protein
MDAILPGGIIVNPTQRERDVAEKLALRQGTITEIQTRNGTHIISEYVGDNAGFLGRFRPPVSSRVRDMNPAQPHNKR